MIWYFCHTIWSLINVTNSFVFLFSKSKCSRNIYVIGCFDLFIFTESYLGRRKNDTKIFDIICANVWPKTTISTGCLPNSFLVFKVKCFSGEKSIFLWVIMKEQITTMNLICLNFYLTYFACMSHFLCSLWAFDIIWSLNLIRNMKDFSEAELRRPRGPRCIVEPWDLVGEEIENVFISFSYINQEAFLNYTFGYLVSTFGYVFLNARHQAGSPFLLALTDSMIWCEHVCFRTLLIEIWKLAGSSGEIHVSLCSLCWRFINSLVGHSCSLEALMIMMKVMML